MASITLQMSDEELERMQTLAARAGRSVDELAHDFVSGAIDEGSETIDGIERGLADVEAGRVVPASQVAARIDEVLAKLRVK